MGFFVAMRSTLLFRSICSGNERLGFHRHSWCNREKKYLFYSNIFLPRKDIKVLGGHSKHRCLILFVLHKWTGRGYIPSCVRPHQIFILGGSCWCSIVPGVVPDFKILQLCLLIYLLLWSVAWSEKLYDRDTLARPLENFNYCLHV